MTEDCWVTSIFHQPVQGKALCDGIRCAVCSRTYAAIPRYISFDLWLPATPLAVVWLEAAVHTCAASLLDDW
jgi:hypothetical protein